VNVLGGTRVLGVFGHPIEHSLSPVMQNAALSALHLDYVYVPFHVLPDGLGKAVDGIRALGLAGVNVTIPHKERVIEYLDEVSELSRQIRSVNTIIPANGRLRGDTTDGPGFLRSVEAVWGRVDGGRALILGAGGSAKAVAYALAGVGCELVIVNRTPERAAELVEALNGFFGKNVAKSAPLEREALAEEMGKADLLVNTTSVGMYPKVDATLVPAELIRKGLCVYDLVYNPLRTRLVVEAESRGASAMTGLKMLVYQGALSLEMWTDRSAPVDVMEEALIRSFVA